MTAGDDGARRVLVGDVKPYALPARLDELSGPPSGTVVLPHAVLWAGDGLVDLDEPGGTALAYRAVIAEGTVADQVRVLHRERLLAVWPELMLPLRVRQLWERRFPELTDAAVA